MKLLMHIDQLYLLSIENIHEATIVLQFFKYIDCCHVKSLQPKYVHIDKLAHSPAGVTDN